MIYGIIYMAYDIWHMIMAYGLRKSGHSSHLVYGKVKKGEKQHWDEHIDNTIAEIIKFYKV